MNDEEEILTGWPTIVFERKSYIKIRFIVRNCNEIKRKELFYGIFS